eukprot:CAMPEP_0204532900 /NCGR_PEP_ID=MMETSP0661-20131031/11981_1 /ASSEMBLY_ACC=CAM_ASM_000606 /TAXON_ID=109239 /ORGANISM="Alexandrium margalefi, Strain AMGDE01CS-322" /LENGTH=80 /DNA_ID=CAMNT_0051539187 /DNA_START=187 /DNA_END=430 /DNA_ORIENTATION=+
MIPKWIMAFMFSKKAGGRSHAEPTTASMPITSAHLMRASAKLNRDVAPDGNEAPERQLQPRLRASSHRDADAAEQLMRIS